MQTIQGIWNELGAGLRRFVGGRVNDAATADDITQDVLLKVQTQLGDLPPFSFQPGPMNQVVLNLVQNALDALGPRGLVRVRTGLADQNVVLEVIDDGPGVSREAKEHLFEPFFTTKDVGKGTGLGLATSYQIVRMHGGTIELDGAHSPGARFVVRIPLK